MKITKLLIITFLCVGVVSVADARKRRPPPPPPVHHTLTPSAVTATPGGLWSYNADLTSGLLVAGDGFTIFDFGGYVAASITPPVGWVASTALTGSPFGTSLGLDNPTLTNLTFTYTGTTINQTLGATTFIGFTAITTDTAQVSDDWVSRDHDAFTTLLALPANGTILVPGPARVPDSGATVALLGIAFTGLEGMRRMIRGRNA